MPINDPRDVPGLLAWYSARAVTGLADGATMTQWADLSGNGNHATAAGTPIWHAAGGRAGGARVSLAEPAYFDLPAELFGTAASGEMFLEVRRGSGDRGYATLGTGSSAAHFAYGGRVYDTFGTPNRYDFPAPGVDVWRRYDVWSAPNDWAASFDEVAAFSSSAGVVGWDPNPVIGVSRPAFGSSRYFLGDLGCVLLFDHKLTAGERADVAAWLTANPDGGVRYVPPPPVPSGGPYDEVMPYAAHLRVGSHSWDVSTDDPPAHGPIAGLRFSWAARQDDGWPTQHDPTLLTFGVVVEHGTDFDDVDQGSVVHFTFTPDGYSTPLVEFGGTVRDLVGAPHDRGMVYTITAVDHLQGLREDYTVQAYIDGNSPSSMLWTEVLKDAGGAGGGEGIRPALTDPFTGDVIPYSLGGGFLGTDPVVFGDPTPEPAWNVLTGLLAQGISRLGVSGGPGHRGILTYRLDVDGNLDAAQPYEGTWAAMGADNPPLSYVDDPGANLDGCLLRTDATVWSRQRVEPNRVEFTGFLAGSVFYERPHTGPDVIRYLDDDGKPYLSDETDPDWIVAGVENADQWGTEFAVMACYDPAVVDGWFTLPHAMRRWVAVHSIDPRHTPSGSGIMAGLLAGAALVLSPRRRWEVRFRLRRTLPDPAGPYGVG